MAWWKSSLALLALAAVLPAAAQAPASYPSRPIKWVVPYPPAGITDTVTCTFTGAPPTRPCTVTVQGTTLEQATTPANQPNGGGFNSSMSAGTVTLGTPLANGLSINLQFLLGIQQTGNFRIYLNVEALP